MVLRMCFDKIHTALFLKQIKKIYPHVVINLQEFYKQNVKIMPSALVLLKWLGLYYLGLSNTQKIKRFFHKENSQVFG